MAAVRLGQWVTSTAGRDAGCHYVVVKFKGGAFVGVADGRRRTVSECKKKNIRHLWIHPFVDDALALQLQSNGKVTDADVRAALAQMAAREEGVG